MANSISGTIISEETGELITGALIRIEGTKYQAVSGLDGSFTIKDIPAGEYDLVVSMVGFHTSSKKIKLDQQRQSVDFELKTARTSLNEVTVTGSKNGDAAARNREKASSKVLNIVSARTIEISPDLTVANVIQRVSGITVERNNTGDGQYALLRGMDKRYNYTLINGVKIPSPDNKNRFVPLDIFPAEMLERLEVFKSLTPDMEGDGIGGAVNLVMKDAPEKLQVSANIATGVNSLFFDRPFRTFNKDLRESKSPYELLGSKYPAKPRDFNPDYLNPKDASFRPNIYAGVSAGQRFFKNKLGVLIAGTYQNSLRGSNSTDFPYTTATSDASNLPVLTVVNNRNFSEEQVRAGVHARLDYRLSPNHQFQWYNALLNLTAAQVREERKTDFTIGYNPAEGNYNLSYDTRLRHTHQQIINSTLKGIHHFLGNKIVADWSAVYSKASNEIPDNTSIHLVTTARNNIENPRSVVTLGGAERRWEHNTDEDKAGYLNVSYHVNNPKFTPVISAGGMYRDKQRANFFNQYDFRPLDESKPAGQQNNLIEGIDWKKFSDIKFMVFTPFGSVGNPLNYDAAEKITAGYLQGRISTDKFEILAGARLEHTNQSYLLKFPTAGVKNESEQDYTDILPSLHIKLKLTPEKSIKAAYYKAINRPGFFEIVPYRILNEEFVEAGNPELKHTVAHNIDIRYEMFPNRTEQFMIGAFYKKIQNPIEFGMVLQGQGSFYMPNNFGDATNYGAELDFTKYIYSFGFKLNYTYTNSSITTPKLFYYNNPDPQASDKVLLKNVDQTRRLTGQAAHVANFTLLYKNNEQGIDAQLSLAYTGNRLFAVSRYLDNDLWQGGFVQLDLSAEKKLAKRYVLFLKATNLAEHPGEIIHQKNKPGERPCSRI
ncbi:MAG: outer membrane beta-barrel protein [Chitinophagaceae bacterium]|nr:outer membrane beta-barrel protein [Chitinophagaceae bacterium]